MQEHDSTKSLDNFKVTVPAEEYTLGPWEGEEPEVRREWRSPLRTRTAAYIEIVGVMRGETPCLRWCVKPLPVDVGKPRSVKWEQENEGECGNGIGPNRLATAKKRADAALEKALKAQASK